MGKMIVFKRPDGKEVDGYLAEPAAGKGGGPGLVVIQEWWGLNDQIRGVADRYAAAGFCALVPDLYRGRSTVEAAEAEHLMKGLDFGDAAGQDVRGAVQYLKGAPRPAEPAVPRGGPSSPAEPDLLRGRCGKVGVTGYCMGGALTLLAVVNVPEADAGVVWYGFPPLEYIDAGKIGMPLLGHFGTEDSFFPVATLGLLEDKLRAANVDFEFHRYVAKHAFANETQVGANRLPANEYQPDAAALAWTRTLGFLDRHLR